MCERESAGKGREGACLLLIKSFSAAVRCYAKKQILPRSFFLGGHEEGVSGVITSTSEKRCLKRAHGITKGQLYHAK